MGFLDDNGLSLLWEKTKELVENNSGGSGGGTGGDTAYDLLWENPDHTASFVAQEITVADMSPYAFIMFVCRYRASADYPYYFSHTVPTGEDALLCFYTKSTGGRRYVNYVDKNTLSFQGGSNSDADNNAFIIPTKIYGISNSVIGRQLTTEDVVDDLESTEPFRVLSANQGRILDGKIEAINERVTGLSASSLTLYSLTENAIGTWIDGKTIYRKVIDFGTLPNNTSKKATVDLSMVDQFVDVRAIAQHTTNKTAQPISYASPSNLSNAISITANTGDNTITIVTGLNKTSYHCYVIIEYTKLETT